MKLLVIDQRSNAQGGENNMGTAVAVIIVVVIALLVLPIIPTESCTTTTADVKVFGIKVGENTINSCNPTSWTSILAIFLKGLNSP